MTEITVIGAGIAGLAAATALAQRGFSVRVIEQADAVSEVGAGLQISPNGTVVLRALGLGDALDEAGVKAQAGQLIDGPTGRKVVGFSLAEGDYRFLHRADLIEMLHRAAHEAGVKIELGRKVASVAVQDGAVVLRFETGEEEVQPIVIGADGVHSVARPALGPSPDPRFTGQVAWRALVRNPADSDPIARVHMGPGKHLVHYPLAGGRLMNIVAIEERNAWVADGWNFAADPARLRAAFADFALPVRDLLGAVEEVHLWGLHSYPVLSTWSKGGLCVIGDAAHPTLPFLGQGANMGLEDAWALADALEGGGGEAALGRFGASRVARTTRIVRASGSNARNYHLRGIKRLVAHALLRAVGAVTPRLFLRSLGWLYNYDVTKDGIRKTGSD